MDLLRNLNRPQYLSQQSSSNVAFSVSSTSQPSAPTCVRPIVDPLHSIISEKMTSRVISMSESGLNSPPVSHVCAIPPVSSLENGLPSNGAVYIQPPHTTPDSSQLLHLSPSHFNSFDSNHPQRLLDRERSKQAHHNGPTTTFSTTPIYPHQFSQHTHSPFNKNDLVPTYHQTHPIQLPSGQYPMGVHASEYHHRIFPHATPATYPPMQAHTLTAIYSRNHAPLTVQPMSIPAHMQNYIPRTNPLTPHTNHPPFARAHAQSLHTRPAPSPVTPSPSSVTPTVLVPTTPASLLRSSHPAQVSLQSSPPTTQQPQAHIEPSHSHIEQSHSHIEQSQIHTLPSEPTQSSPCAVGQPTYVQDSFVQDSFVKIVSPPIENTEEAIGHVFCHSKIKHESALSPELMQEYEVGSDVKRYPPQTFVHDDAISDNARKATENNVITERISVESSNDGKIDHHGGENMTEKHLQDIQRIHDVLASGGEYEDWMFPILYDDIDEEHDAAQSTTLGLNQVIPKTVDVTTQLISGVIELDNKDREVHQQTLETTVFYTQSTALSRPDPNTQEDASSDFTSRYANILSIAGFANRYYNK